MVQAGRDQRSATQGVIQKALLDNGLLGNKTKRGKEKIFKKLELFTKTNLTSKQPSQLITLKDHKEGCKLADFNMIFPDAFQGLEIRPPHPG